VLNCPAPRYISLIGRCTSADTRTEHLGDELARNVGRMSMASWLSRYRPRRCSTLMFVSNVAYCLDVIIVFQLADEE
jgi:hypothetical protein